MDTRATPGVSRPPARVRSAADRSGTPSWRTGAAARAALPSSDHTPCRSGCRRASAAQSFRAAGAGDDGFGGSGLAGGVVATVKMMATEHPPRLFTFALPRLLRFYALLFLHTSSCLKRPQHHAFPLPSRRRLRGLDAPLGFGPESGDLAVLDAADLMPRLTPGL